jgi:hypothetical protein
MIFFFHHYELPIILDQIRQQNVTGLQDARGQAAGSTQPTSGQPAGTQQSPPAQAAAAAAAAQRSWPAEQPNIVSEQPPTTGDGVQPPGSSETMQSRSVDVQSGRECTEAAAQMSPSSTGSDVLLRTGVSSPVQQSPMLPTDLVRQTTSSSPAADANVYYSAIQERASGDGVSDTASNSAAKSPSCCDDELPFGERIVGVPSAACVPSEGSGGGDENTVLASSPDRDAVVQPMFADSEAMSDDGGPLVPAPMNVASDDVECTVDGLRLKSSQQCSENAEPYTTAENVEQFGEDSEQSGVVRLRKKTLAD